jgi:hypothetical protein
MVSSLRILNTPVFGGHLEPGLRTRTRRVSHSRNRQTALHTGTWHTRTQSSEILFLIKPSLSFYLLHLDLATNIVYPTNTNWLQK